MLTFRWKKISDFENAMIKVISTLISKWVIEVNKTHHKRQEGDESPPHSGASTKSRERFEIDQSNSKFCANHRLRTILPCLIVPDH